MSINRRKFIGSTLTRGASTLVTANVENKDQTNKSHHHGPNGKLGVAVFGEGHEVVVMWNRCYTEMTVMSLRSMISIRQHRSVQSNLYKTRQNHYPGVSGE